MRRMLGSPSRWQARDGGTCHGFTSSKSGRPASCCVGRQLLHPDPSAQAAKVVEHPGRRSTERLSRWSGTRQRRFLSELGGSPKGPPFLPGALPGGTLGYMRIRGIGQALHLNDPGVRLRRVAEVWNDASAAVWLRNLNADPAVLLPRQSVCRFPHGRQCRLVIGNATFTPVCSFC
jgi:hypothetical protein